MADIVTTGNYSRSYYTLSELQDRVLGDLGYRNNNLITSGDITNWANEAQTILARRTKAFHLTVVSGTTSGTTEYPLPSDSLGRALSIEAVMYSGAPLQPVAQNELLARDYWWFTRPAGTPQVYYVQGFSSIGLYPCPDTTTAAGLTLMITALPPQVTADNDFFYLPTGMDDAIITYCKLMASLKDGYGEGKARLEIYAPLWQQALREADQFVEDVAENEHLRMGENAQLFRANIDPFWVNPQTVASPLT